MKPYIEEKQCLNSYKEEKVFEITPAGKIQEIKKDKYLSNPEKKRLIEEIEKVQRDAHYIESAKWIKKHNRDALVVFTIFYGVFAVIAWFTN